MVEKLKIELSEFYEFLELRDYRALAGNTSNLMFVNYILTKKEKRLFSIRIIKNLIISLDCDFDCSMIAGLIDSLFDYLAYIKSDHQYSDIIIKFS